MVNQARYKFYSQLSSFLTVMKTFNTIPCALGPFLQRFQGRINVFNKEGLITPADTCEEQNLINHIKTKLQKKIPYDQKQTLPSEKQRQPRKKAYSIELRRRACSRLKDQGHDQKREAKESLLRNQEAGIDSSVRVPLGDLTNNQSKKEKRSYSVKLKLKPIPQSHQSLDQTQMTFSERYREKEIRSQPLESGRGDELGEGYNRRISQSLELRARQNNLPFWDENIQHQTFFQPRKRRIIRPIKLKQ